MALTPGPSGPQKQAPSKPAATQPVKADAAAPEKKAPSKPRARVQRPALDMSKIGVVQINNPQTMAKLRPAKKERDSEQKQIDAIVEKAWEAWKNTGRPTRWTDMQGMRLTVPLEQYETLVYRIRQAGTYLDLKVRFGSMRKSKGPDGIDYAETVFVATSRPAPKKTAEGTPAAPANPTAAVEGTGQTEA